MGIDVKAEVVINRSRDEVAGYATDLGNDTVWIGGISEARMLTDPPVRQGTRVERVASFLGKRIEYVLEVTEHDPSATLAMRSIKAPFPMEVTYEFEEAARGTLMRILIQGEATGFYRLGGPMMSLAVKRNITKDLTTLKGLSGVRGRRFLRPPKRGEQKCYNYTPGGVLNPKPHT